MPLWRHTARALRHATIVTLSSCFVFPRGQEPIQGILSLKQNFAQVIFTLYRQTPLNIQLSWKKLKKASTEQNKSRSLEIECRTIRIEVDYSSWNLIYWQAVKKSNLPFLLNIDFSSCYFVCLVHISLILSLLWMVLFQFPDNKVSLKQVPSHNQENTIFQPEWGHCPSQNIMLKYAPSEWVTS